MRTKSLREALVNLAEEAAELSAAAARVVNKHRRTIPANNHSLNEVWQQQQDVYAVIGEINTHLQIACSKDFHVKSLREVK